MKSNLEDMACGTKLTLDNFAKKAQTTFEVVENVIRYPLEYVHKSKLARKLFIRDFVHFELHHWPSKV
jgi:hypothetical protein